jgi:hypothetical protein
MNADQEFSMSTPRNFIEDIKNRQLNSDKEFILDSLSGAIDRLQKAFPRYGSFLMEFIQNADDAKSKSLRIDILDNAIRIYNDGEVFSKDHDVKNICKVGRSFKTPKDFIGYLGVGFKSIFLISQCAEIYSGDYRFGFNKAAWEEPDITPWQIIPLWIDNPSIDLFDDYKTGFNIYLKDINLLGKLIDEIKEDHLNNRIILFLRHINKIDIFDLTHTYNRNIVKTPPLSREDDYEIVQILEYENGELKTQDRWLIFKESCDVPLSVKNDLTTKEWERDKLNKREVLVAYRLNEENSLIIEKFGTAHIGVYSFLPLKEVLSGLNFLIQADFLTMPGRGELARECLWNEWLADEILNLITGKCINNFLRHEKWKMNFTQILCSSPGGHELFDFRIKKPLKEYIDKNPLLIAQDGTTCNIDELIIVTDEIKELFSEGDFDRIYSHKKMVHSDCSPYYELKVEKAPNDIRSFIDSAQGEILLQIKSSNNDAEWFIRLYSIIVNKYTHDYFRRNYHQYNVAYDDFWNRMHSFHKPIILTENYELSKINECYINPKKIKIPVQVKDNFKIVHPSITKDSQFIILINKLNDERYHYKSPDSKVIRELELDDIKNTMAKKEARELDEEKWINLSEEDKIDKIIHLKQLWDTGYLSLDQYNFITLQTKNGEWLKPGELLFPKEYKPQQNLEILTEKGLLDLPLHFLTSHFIESEVEDNKIKKWRKFFDILGVDGKIKEIEEKQKGKKGGIINRISVLTAMKFEKDQERNSRELGESEKMGYDIISTSENGERYIEVKGTSKNNYDIVLYKSQFENLQKRPEKYYVYIILNCLENPTLYPIKGPKLLDVTYKKMMIPNKEWRDIIEEEYQP